MRATKGKVFKSQPKFEVWLTKPWSFTTKLVVDVSGKVETRSGPNKLHHGLELQKTIDGKLILSCKWNGGTLVPDKFGQFLGGDDHWRRHQEELSNVAAANRPPRDPVVVEIIEGETLAEAYDRFKNEAITKLDKDNKAEKLSGHTTVCDNIIVCLLHSFHC